jgi:hypothetical protein
LRPVVFLRPVVLRPVVLRVPVDLRAPVDLRVPVERPDDAVDLRPVDFFLPVVFFAANPGTSVLLSDGTSFRRPLPDDTQTFVRNQLPTRTAHNECAYERAFTCY